VMRPDTQVASKKAPRPVVEEEIGPLPVPLFDIVNLFRNLTGGLPFPRYRGADVDIPPTPRLNARERARRSLVNFLRIAPLCIRRTSTRRTGTIAGSGFGEVSWPT